MVLSSGGHRAGHAIGFHGKRYYPNESIATAQMNRRLPTGCGANFLACPVYGRAGFR